MKTKTLLKGEGINEHVLVGSFNELDTDVLEILDDRTFVRHQTPSGEKAEHESIKLDEGLFILGDQVEYSPIEQLLTRVMD